MNENEETSILRNLFLSYDQQNVVDDDAVTFEFEIGQQGLLNKESSLCLL